LVQANPPKQDSFLVNLGTSSTGSIDDNNFFLSVVYYDNGEQVGGSFSSKVVLKEQEQTMYQGLHTLPQQGYYLGAKLI